MEAYYFNSNPKYFGIKTDFNKAVFGHQIYKEPKILFLTPIQFNKNNICPRNALLFKEKHKLKNIVIFDRVRGTNKNIVIADHVNRSGISFLVQKTPHKNLPMFPDMSGVYITNNNEKRHTVHTLGPGRFPSQPKEKGVVFSEAAAITASLWHYIGVGVRCFGVCAKKDHTNPLKPL